MSTAATHEDHSAASPARAQLDAGGNMVIELG